MMLQEKLFKPTETININDALSFAVEKAAVIMEFFETVNIIPTFDATFAITEEALDTALILAAFAVAMVFIVLGLTLTKKD